ncbi:DegT/DnrJ/EryC1/StrS aminotransferase family protein [Butyrivibrio sp. FCS006]|uniref:DegT/DnrJ/EryC1/StrS family aminotransferase n=1 Tax=Butyrivibrio sp. FCS006 TaxID=1280684 RepID=UPI000425E1D9|nr:DegT/DnrJ/EryC1/StrS family aminotransferase [Butyrivibrio sp. FCS006]
MEENIYVTRPSLPPVEEYIEYVRQIWDSHNLTNMGMVWQEFNKGLSAFLQEQHVLPMSNGHMALEMALQALDITGEVITTPFTFASTTHAIVRNNLTPVFCDIKESDCTIDPDKIEELITDKTSAIVPVHVYGMPCDVERIEKIAQRHNLKVIYDAAHAFGERINGVSISRYGDISMFSFHATKCFNTIEGGCAVTRDKETMLKIYQLHNFGIVGRESVELVGANAKMNEFQAAMGICNLKHFEENRNARKVIFNRYRERLSGINGLRLLDYDEDKNTYNYSYMPIFVDSAEYGMNRDALRELLAKKHIYARKYFYPITNKFNCYKNIGFRGNTEIAEQKSKQVLALPLYADLNIETVEEICNVIEEGAGNGVR